MRFRLALAAVLLQVAVLAYMAGEREWILRTGVTILLRTAPLDPHDAMRGDYVQLDYEIAHVPRPFCHGDLERIFSRVPQTGQSKEATVYANLKLNETGVAELTSLTDAKPTGGLFIRGRTGSSAGPGLQVRYGIEAFFMQQGEAKKLEDMRRKDRPGVPLDMEIAVGSSGIAVPKGYKWEPLGITLTFDRASAPAGADEPVRATRARPRQLLTGINVELKNYGPEDVAIVDLPNGGSFRLVPSSFQWQQAQYRWVGEDQPRPAAATGQVIVLRPGQSHTTKIDLTQPEWFVTKFTTTGERQRPQALREITDIWAASFRVEYAPPGPESTVGLPHADLIRHANLRSRMFNPGAGMD